MATRKTKRKLDVDTDTQTSTTTIDPVWIPDLNLADSDRNLVRSGELNDKSTPSICWSVANWIRRRRLPRLLRAPPGLTPWHRNLSWYSMVTSTGWRRLERRTASSIWTACDHINRSQPTPRQLSQLFATFVDDQGQLRMKTVPSTPQINSTDCAFLLLLMPHRLWLETFEVYRAHLTSVPCATSPLSGTMSRTTICNSISKGVSWSVWSASQGHHCRRFLARLWSCHVVAESWHR